MGRLDRVVYMHSRGGFGVPYRGNSAKTAAVVILSKSWQYERDSWGSWPNIVLEEPGLLTSDDIHRIGPFDAAAE